MEVRVGGIWEYVMRGPDGTDYPSKRVYRVVEKPKLQRCRRRSPFEESTGRTEVPLRMRFPSTDALEHAKERGAEQGGNEGFARLDYPLSNLTRRTL